jgi:parallel beta-helix repeat protein
MGDLDIVKNEIRDCSGCDGDGIHVYYTFRAYGSSNISIGRALIKDNTIENCSGNGIYLYFYIHEKDRGATITLGNATITDNTIKDNEHGIYLHMFSNCTITYNKIINNTGGATGVHVDASSHDNEIHRNCFIDNVPQANDDGQRNNWDNNYWSDYTGALLYYPIPEGSSSSQDNSPLEYCPGSPHPSGAGVGGILFHVDKIKLLLPHILTSTHPILLILLTMGYIH